MVSCRAFTGKGGGEGREIFREKRGGSAISAY